MNVDRVIKQYLHKYINKSLDITRMLENEYYY